MYSMQRKLVLRRSAMAAALACALAPAAWAQSNASGAIYGQIAGGAGSTVQIDNTDNGMTRTVTVDSDGRYRVSSLPIGHYKVTLLKGGQRVDSREGVNVTIAGNSEVSFGGAGPKTLEGVTVVASALPSIDVSSVDTRTVFTSDQLAKIPVARNVLAVALLAPGVIAGDNRFANAGLAIGGSGISENAYSINGYNVTNPLNNETFFELPFGAIDQQQILEGGAGAEFGHSTGGFINLVGKRGSNEWKGGVAAFWRPDSLRSNPRNYYYPEHPDAGSLAIGPGPFNHRDDSGNLLTDEEGINRPFGSNGKLRRYRGKNTYGQFDYSAWIGGPLIKDRLFFFGAAQFTKTDQQGTLSTSDATYTPTGALTPSAARSPNGGFRKDHDKATKWYAKVDWNITDSHLLELTALQDNSQSTQRAYGWSNETLSPLGHNASADGRVKNNNELYLGKYTGYITDDFTVTALYGESKTYQPNLANIPDYPLVRVSANAPPAVRNAYHAYQPLGIVPYDTINKTKGWRLDLEYRLGSHDLRGGVDRQTLNTAAGEAYVNSAKYGGYWRYGVGNTVQLITHKQGGKYKLEQEAYYLEDHWQVTDRWLAYLGVRNESFKNFNSAGEEFMKQSNQWAPRLGVSWDVQGDASLKIYANAGRYYLALPNGVAIRGAGGSLNTQQTFTYSGIDPKTDLPLNLVAQGPAVSPNGEFGQPRDPRTARIQDLRAHYQDEFILGADKQLTPSLTVGARATYRQLKSQVDDTSDPRPVCAYLASHYQDYSSAADCMGRITYPGVIFNPGRGAEFDVNIARPGAAPVLRHVKLSAQDFGMPKPVRKYLALDLYAEHPFDGTWYGRVDYVWSHNWGNTEGQIKSDIVQEDVAASQDWDFPQFMRYASGNLPNDRRHAIRAFGYWQLTPEWLISSTVSLTSGRPKNCLGAWFKGPDGVYTDPAGYMGRDGDNGAYHVCYDQVSPRGSKGTLPWTYRLDLGAQWRPAFADHKLALGLDVFNVFNQQRAISISETAVGGQVGSNADGSSLGGSPSNMYGGIQGYTEPRYVRISAQYDFSL